MKGLLLAWILSNAFDLGSTEIGLMHGGYELNPILAKREVRIPLRVTTTIVGAVFIKKEYKDHPKAVTIFVLTTSAIYAGVSINNFSIKKE
jgi:hypothetical protein